MSPWGRGGGGGGDDDNADGGGGGDDDDDDKDDVQSVSETAPVGTTVVTLPVTDDDVDQGVSQTVSFAIAGIPTGGFPHQFTFLSPLSGHRELHKHTSYNTHCDNYATAHKQG